MNNKSKAKPSGDRIPVLVASPEQTAYFQSTRLSSPHKSRNRNQLWKDYSEINPLLDRVISLMVFAPQGDLKIPVGRAKALADDDFSKYVKGIYYDDCTRDIEAVLDECADRVQYILDTNGW